MNKREKILLMTFALLFGGIVGGGLVTYSVKNYREVSAENESLRQRVDEMTTSIAQGADWKGRSEWVENNMPAFGSLEDARQRLLEVVQNQARKAGVAIGGKEFIEQARALVGPDGEAAQPAAYFDRATVKVTLAGVKEQQLFAWMHGLQEPKSFLGITRFQIAPSGQGKTVNCEVEITQFYREGQAPKLTHSN